MEQNERMDQKGVPEIVIQYVDFIMKERPQIKKVWLFGSYAKNQHHLLPPFYLIDNLLPINHSLF
jgi:hypothetical protein